MNDELIRKTDVLDLLNNLVNDFGDNYELYSTLFDSVDEMATVDAAQPKTARWIRHFPIMGKDFECSECGNVVMTAFECFKDGCYYDYCPNCGAKMER